MRRFIQKFSNYLLILMYLLGGVPAVALGNPDTEASSNAQTIILKEGSPGCETQQEFLQLVASVKTASPTQTWDKVGCSFTGYDTKVDLVTQVSSSQTGFVQIRTTGAYGAIFYSSGVTSPITLWINPSLWLVAMKGYNANFDKAKAAAGAPMTAHSVEVKIRRAIVNKMFEGVPALFGKITHVEAVCVSDVGVCTHSTGEWIINVDDKLFYGLTLEHTAKDALYDIKTVDEAIYSSGFKIHWVGFDGYLPMTDQYGNTSSGIAIHSRLIAATAHKINWTGITPQMLWALQTQTIVIPELQQYLLSD